MVGADGFQGLCRRRRHPHGRRSLRLHRYGLNWKFSTSRNFTSVFAKGAYILGPRFDRFRDGKSTYISGHSLPLVSLGGFILIMGFMAFNGGSQASISKPGDGEAIGRAVQATFISCGTGGATVLFLFKLVVNGTWSLTQIINGCLAGMVGFEFYQGSNTSTNLIYYLGERVLWSQSVPPAICRTPRDSGRLPLPLHLQLDGQDQSR